MTPKFIIFAAIFFCASAIEVRAQMRLDFSVGHSALSGGREDWTDVGLALSRADERGGVTLLLEHNERFGLSDVYGEARFFVRRPGFEAYGAIGLTDDADFRPQLALRAGGEWAVSDLHWLIDADVSRYENELVATARPGVRRHFELRESWIEVRAIAVSGGETGFGYSASAEASVAPRLRARIGVFNAPEVSENQIIRVSGVSAAALFDVNDRVLLRLDGLVEDRAGYDRRSVSAGMAWRF